MKAQAVPFHVTFIKAPVRVQAEKFPGQYLITLSSFFLWPSFLKGRKIYFVQ
jgi:hypothetical protein